MAGSPNAEIKIGGSPIGEALKPRRSRVEVEDHLILPDTFAVYFHDPRHSDPDDRQRGSGSLLSQNGIEIGKEVSISAAANEGDQKELLIEGEVTAIEGAYDEVNSYIVVRGYDKTHRLHRGKKTQAVVQKRDSDLVSEAAGVAQLAQGQVDDPGTQKEHFFRANLTDWQLIQARAKATGREARAKDGKFDYRTPTEASGAPSPSAPAGTNPKVMKYPTDLMSFNPRVTAPQYGKVEVRGWDPVKKEAVKPNPVDVTSTSASINGQKPKDLAGTFGDAVFVQSTPFTSAQEVSDVAAALAEQIGSTFAEADGVARGHPQLKAGTAITVEGVSDEFKGKWTITSSRHVMSWDAGAEEPYVTYLEMSGRQDRSLMGLTSTESSNGALGSGTAIYGVNIGLVVNTKDPDNRGRVKVQFPWLPDPNESDWARVVQPGAGKGRGMVSLPEVGDEVLVAFQMGDPQVPIVIGNLYNGVDKPSTTEGDPLTRDNGQMALEGYVSHTGHRLVFQDKDGFVLLRTGPDDGSVKYLLKLDKTNKIIEVTSDGKVTIKGADDITVKGDANIKVEAGGNLDEKAGGNVKIEASGNMDLKAGGNMNVQASGMTTIKGSTIQLN
jgi:phage protein D/phage baseplate assembly protein gpV